LFLAIIVSVCLWSVLLLQLDSSFSFHAPSTCSKFLQIRSVRAPLCLLWLPERCRRSKHCVLGDYQDNVGKGCKWGNCYRKGECCIVVDGCMCVCVVVSIVVLRVWYLWLCLCWGCDFIFAYVKN
jgi:hypothetical protein